MTDVTQGGMNYPEKYCAKPLIRRKQKSEETEEKNTHKYNTFVGKNEKIQYSNISTVHTKKFISDLDKTKLENAYQKLVGHFANPTIQENIRVDVR